MAMETFGPTILGAVKAENSNLAEVDEDNMMIADSRANDEGLVVVNRAPAFNEDLMAVDNAPTEISLVMEAKVQDLETTVGLANATGLCSGPVGCFQQPELEVGIVSHESFRAETSNMCQAAIKMEQNGAKKQLKRKRVSIGENLAHESVKALMAEWQRELNELFEYYKEFTGLTVQPEDGMPINSIIACFLEERHIALSKLVEEVYEKLKGKEGVTLASARGAVHSVGKRMSYGISNADADVLEDESESSLWCWETLEIKILPKSMRGYVNIRRRARKMIHERIAALSATLSTFSSSEHLDSYKNDLVRKLAKVPNKQEISSRFEDLKRKNYADMVGKEAKLKEKKVINEIEKIKRSSEKEKKKIDRELQKEKLQTEKEFKRMQDEAEREEKRREKEEAELKKQKKKQQEEAAKEQKRREKEETELKKKLAIQKQASIMERFLKSKKSNNGSDNSEKKPPVKGPFSEIAFMNERDVSTATSYMDAAFSQQYNFAIEDLHRLHVDGWRKLAHHNRSCHWGVRRNPKTELIKEIKLQQPSLESEPVQTIAIPDNGSEPNCDKLNDELEDSFVNSMSCQNDPGVAPASVHLLNKKLLQFDKSYRPAYYGTWCRKSAAAGPRHPFRKDPELDYDVDSDEEWEEEDPGESLSDCEKENEESLDEDHLKNEDDDESEGSFVVPDGYLSENEGLEIETSSDPTMDDVKGSSCCNLEADSEQFRALLQQQKFLCNLTVKALRKSQPLVISNLNHEKAELLIAEDLTGTAKIEQKCLLALCMRACPGGSNIDLPTNCSPLYELQEVSQSTKEINTPAASSSPISDSDLPEFVRAIQSCPHGMNKLVEVLQNKFPTTSKKQLKNKVKEISTFADNYWQVNRDIVEKLRLSASQEESGKPKGITSFFSKRCLPPDGECFTSESSPEKSSGIKPQSNATGTQCPN